LISVSFYTLGCKVNQIETEAVSDAFREGGCTVLPWIEPEENPGNGLHGSSDLCIINTCTVTSKAEQKARRIIRLCLRRGSVVMVTGCYAQLERKELAALGEEKLFVLPGKTKDKLLDLPRYLAESRNTFPDFSADKSYLSVVIAKWLEECGFGVKTEKELPAADPFRFSPKHFLFHSRGFLKIQDGCDRSCAYCRVPLARGKSVSLGSGEVLCRLKALEEGGMAEAVITAVNICQYMDPEGNIGPAGPRPGMPENRPLSLPGLLRFLLDNTEHIALRLSSLEPEFFEPGAGTDDIFAVLAHPRIRNHFHLSVQSGSDTVLAAMGRPYRAREILRLTEKLRAARDDPFLACDIIVGFPGETEEDFEKTVQLCRTVDFAWIHAFPYSKRPGTASAAMKKGLVSQRAAGERMGILMEIAREGRSGYIRRWLGKTVEAVAESPPAGKPVGSGFFPALTDNYIKVLAVSKGEKPMPGTAFRCKIEKAREPPGEFDAWAEPVIQADANLF